MYWWNDVETNDIGESLQTCLEKYGTGKDYCPRKNMGIKVLFLDATKSFKKSWLLAVTLGRVDDGEWRPVCCHMEDADTYIRLGDPTNAA